MADALPADLSVVEPAEAWKPWEPAKDEWNRKWAAHLYRRAAFGATPAVLAKATADGLPKTLDALIRGSADMAELLELTTETGKYIDNPSDLRAWWLYTMIEGGHPLREKLTLFWHNHFATSYAKVRLTKLMYRQNVTTRRNALGQFRPFLLDMSKDTAMLIWLDSNQNVKGAPNENYAREVMELFSLGTGNYTEKDVREAARSFTGWHHDTEGNKFENNPLLHDDGEKTFLGKTGRWAGTDIVRICCDQLACAKFLTGKLYRYLVSETAPPKGLLDPLVASFRKSDYDIAGLVRTMLTSQLFFSQHAYHKRVKWPVEYALGSISAATPGRIPLSDLVDPLAKMGQVLFNPPNVKGWRTGTDWLNSATLLARNNFAERVAMGEWSKQRSRPPRGATFAPVPDPAQPSGPVTTASPPAPPADQDPVAVIYAAKPKDIGAIVKQMGELLYGDKVSAAQVAKIEKFLHEPGPPPGQPMPQPKGQPGGPPGLTPPPVEKSTGSDNKTNEDPKKDEPKKTEPKKKDEPKKPYKPDLQSDEFKARVREAMHAMMCLPEYQLN